MISKIVNLLGTGFGTGYAPIAPGTVGSLAALILFIILPFTHLTWLSISVLVFLGGIWISDVIESTTEKDPQEIVIDEFVGQWVSLLFLPRHPVIFIAGFVLFRVFDIIKPFPANISQKINGGLGIMLDDIWAGIYSNLTLQVIVYFYF
jgi:phosphatidylglycerophosphatase A